MVSLNYVVAIVERQGIRIPVVVFEHEVDVLRFMHGSVEIDPSIEPPVASAEIDPSEEFDRLQNTYCKGENNPVVAVFGSRQNFVAIFGVDGRVDAQDDAPRRGRKSKPESSEAQPG